MTGWVAGVALLAWLIGVVVLGLDWRGHQTPSGAWVDGVSLRQWFACWALLALLGGGTGHYLRRWPVRLLALGPLLTWTVWQLAGGALGPIPMVVYVVPTVGVWCVALEAGRLVRGALARSMKQ